MDLNNHFKIILFGPNYHVLSEVCFLEEGMLHNEVCVVHRKGRIITYYLAILMLGYKTDTVWETKQLHAIWWIQKLIWTNDDFRLQKRDKNRWNITISCCSLLFYGYGYGNAEKLLTSAAGLAHSNVIHLRGFSQKPLPWDLGSERVSKRLRPIVMYFKGGKQWFLLKSVWGITPLIFCIWSSFIHHCACWGHQFIGCWWYPTPI